jgi:hypothetical protein
MISLVSNAMKFSTSGNQIIIGIDVKNPEKKNSNNDAIDQKC